jgi:uncharacterized membrane protein YkvA (DUF1232 family)
MKCPACQTINSVVTDTCAGCGASLVTTPKEGSRSSLADKITTGEARSYSPYILFALAILYTISPVDLIPDVPIVGWIDDLLFLLLSGSNLLEKGVGATHPNLKHALRLFKWVVLISGVIAIAVLGLLGAVIYKLVWG